VLILNDDYTPMEFVVTVLRRYFNKTPDEAHSPGQGSGFLAL
jgi:ATP-dependent Clp protease adaptor protein ClpS